ncbi:MAG: protein-arginine deiminase family protein [Candidatus Ozemobacteraceae bacterium]
MFSRWSQMRKVSILACVGLVLTLSVNLLSAAPKEVAPADVESLRVVGNSNLPHKILVAAALPGNLKFLRQLLTIVDDIHRQDKLVPEDRFKVYVIPSWVDEKAELLQKALSKDLWEKYVEVSPSATADDVWLQDVGEVAMVKIRGEKKPQLAIFDSNRGEGLAELPGFLANFWNCYYFKNPSLLQTGGDQGGNIEITPDDILVVGNRMSDSLREWFASRGYRDRMCVVESDWLVVGHCDEFLSFVPIDDPQDGYAIVKANPRLALRLLADATKEELARVKPPEYGRRCLEIHEYLTRLQERAKLAGETDNRKSLTPFAQSLLDYLKRVDPVSGEVTGDEKHLITRRVGPSVRAEGATLGDSRDEDIEAFIKNNLALANLIDSNIAKVEATVNKIRGRSPKTAMKVLSYPMLFDVLGRSKRMPGKPATHISLFPGVVNQLVLRKHLVTPDPLIASFRKQIQTVTRQQGLRVHFIDGLYYHRLRGDVHCATNVLRLPNRYIVIPPGLPR